MKGYSKEQLSGKSLDELRQIAEEFGINASKFNESQLVYEILDKSAIAAAAEKVANEKPARKRQRVKAVDHVYSASKLNAKKIEKPAMMPSERSLFGDLSEEEKEILSAPMNSANDKSVETEDISKKDGNDIVGNAETDADTSVSDNGIQEAIEENAASDQPKKKRGRPKKVKEETEDSAPEETQEQQGQTDQKKKRGRPRKNVEDASAAQDEETIIEGVIEDVEPENNEVKDFIGSFESNETAAKAKAPLSGDVFDNGSDFIILEDIPNEDIQFERTPQSFFDKFKQNSTPAENDAAYSNPSDNFNTPWNNNAEDMGYNDNMTQEPYDFSDLITTSGVLDLTSDNYGFLRSSDYNYLSSPDDIYVSPAQVKHYGLKTGDVVEGTIRPPRDGEKFFPLTSINKINGCDPSIVRDRVPFEYLTPLFPDEKFRLCSGKDDTPSSRIVDLFSPIGKGQRALIVAQPKTGKTLLMKDIANSIARNHPEAYLMMLLIDERPEEVTDMARTVHAEVIASTFDAPAENHVKIANLVLEKAKRMVECGHDVVIFLDSITRLARAFNTVSPASGKVLTGGVDANALQKPKRFFGAARNIEGGGSLTIIATALIDTGSKMDEVIFEEFKGTGNMELQLDRTLSNKRVFPAVNLVASSTRRDDLLQDQSTIRRMWILRKHIADMTSSEAMDIVLSLMQRTDTNEEFLISMNG